MPATSYPPHPHNRERVVRFRVADDEYEDMAQRARREGKPLSAYLRECALREPERGDLTESTLAG